MSESIMRPAGHQLDNAVLNETKFISC